LLLLNQPKSTNMKKTSFQDLDIYQSSMDLFLKIHPTTLALPKFEMYELGSQLRRSADGVVSNIVEGYGRKRYKAEFIRYLIFSHSGCLETQNHIEKLLTLYPDKRTIFKSLLDQYISLGIKIYNFITYVEKNWKV